MTLNAFGETVRELCIRRGMSPQGWQTELARRMDADGYAEKWNLQDTRKQLNKYFQVKHGHKISPAVLMGVKRTLQVDEDELVAFMDSWHEAAYQSLR